MNTKVLLVLTGLTVSSATAHVHFEYPLGGEQFRHGEVVVIRWNINAAHPLADWDIWYSLDGPNGPWQELVINYPKGDTTQGSVHEYVWTVPEIETEHLRLRIRQDNLDFDWEDTTAFDMTVIAENCCAATRGSLGDDSSLPSSITDLAILAGWLFQSGPPPRCVYEANVDGSPDGTIDIIDLMHLTDYLFAGGPPPASCP